jgi:hypothetical protein
MWNLHTSSVKKGKGLLHACMQAFSYKGVQASWDAHRTKNGRLWTPKFWGEREIIFNDFPKYINISETNSFNSHYYYTFDILINLMEYLAE